MKMPEKSFAHFPHLSETMRTRTQCQSFVFPFIHCYRMTFPCCSRFLCHYTGNSCTTSSRGGGTGWGTYLLAIHDSKKATTLHRLLAALLATHGAAVAVAVAACPTYAAYAAHAGQARVIGQAYGDHLKCCDSCQKFLTSFKLKFESQLQPLEMEQAYALTHTHTHAHPCTPLQPVCVSFPFLTRRKNRKNEPRIRIKK